MDVLAKLELLRDLPIGSEFPVELGMTDRNWGLVIKVLCGEAAEEIVALRRELGRPPIKAAGSLDAYEEAIAAQAAMEGLEHG